MAARYSKTRVMFVDRDHAIEVIRGLQNGHIKFVFQNDHIIVAHSYENEDRKETTDEVEYTYDQVIELINEEIRSNYGR